MKEHRLCPRALEACAADSPVQTTKQRISMLRDTAIKAKITCVMSSYRPAAEAREPPGGSGESGGGTGGTMPGNIGAPPNGPIIGSFSA
jgi:hypothetical protein